MRSDGTWEIEHRPTYLRGITAREEGVVDSLELVDGKQAVRTILLEPFVPFLNLRFYREEGHELIKGAASRPLDEL